MPHSFHSKPIRIVLTCVFLLALVSVLLLGNSSNANKKVKSVASPLLVPNLSATKNGVLQTDTVGPNGVVNPGDTLRYTATVTNSGTDATGVNFSDTIDANTTLVGGSVIVSPIAVNDTYSSIGNVGISVPMANGVFANDLNPNGSGTLTVQGVNQAGLQGLLSLNTTTGAFDFTPNPGFEGSTSFTYTLGNGTGLTDTATVTINVSGMIWFVNANAGVNGDGRLGAPFNSLANFNAGAADDPNDNIFLFESGTGYSGGITLLSGQKLIGQDATATLASITGITVPPFSSPALPAMNSGNGTVTNLTGTTTLNTNTVVRGLSINSTTNTGINDPAGAITGVSISEVRITTTTGTAVNLTGADGTFNFVSISASGGSNGIIWDNSGGSTATGSFTVNGDGSNTTQGGNSSGGTISNMSGANGAVSGRAIYLNNVANVTLRRMTINGTNQNYGIRGFTVNNFTMEFSTIGGTNGNGGATVDTEPVTLVGGEGSMRFTGLTGTASINGCVLDGGYSRTVMIHNTTGTMGLTINNSIVRNTLTTTDTSDAFFMQGINASTMNLTVTSSTFPAYRQFAIQSDARDTATMAINISGSAFSNSNTSAVSAAGSLSLGSSVSTDTLVQFDIQNNSFRHGAAGSGTAPTNGGAHLVAGTVSGAGKFDGKFINNTVGVSGVVSSGAGNGADALRLFATGNKAGTTRVTGTNETRYLVQGNVIKRYGEVGIQFNARQGNSVINATVLGNTINEPGTAALGAFAAIWVNAGALVADTNTVNIGIGSASVGANKNTMQDSDPNNFSDVFLDKNSCGGCGSTLNLYRNGSTAVGAGEALVRQILVDDNNPTLDLLAGFTGGTIGIQNGLPPQPSFANPADDFATTAANRLDQAGEFLNTLSQSPSEFLTGVQPISTYSTIKKQQIVENAKTFESNESATSYLSSIADKFSQIFIGLSEAISPTVHAEESPNIANTPLSGETVTKAIGLLPAGEQVVIRFDVTVDANIPTNDFSVANTANITADGGININSTTATNTVVHPPTISKAFSPASIAVNGTSTLTFTITNANPATAASNITFTDNFPAGLVVATPLTTTNNCGGTLQDNTGGVLGTGDAGIRLINGSRPANTNCTLSVNVTSTTEGGYPNTTTAISSTEGGTGLTSNTATLTVVTAPSFTKNFGTATLPLTQSTSLTFSITNNSATSSLTNVSFTDTLPAGLVVATPNGLSGNCGGGTITAISGTNTISLSGATLGTSTNCGFMVNVTATTTGMKNNSVSLSTNETATGPTAMASVDVQNLPTNVAVDFDGDGKSDPAVIVGPFPFADGSNESEAIVVGGDILARERQRIWTDSYQRLLYFRSGRGFVELPKDVQKALETWKQNSSKNPYETMLQPEAGLMWSIRQSSNGATLTYMLGTNTDIIVPSDYDGDGKWDPAVYTKSTGMFTVIFSSDMTTHTYTLGNMTSDPTVVGDYDGDGKADPAVYDKSTGMWSYLGGTNHTVLTQVTFGANGIPAPGDYDGDGKFDFGIQVPPTSDSSIAKFRIAYNDGTVTVPDLGIAYGLAIFSIVPGDYDGDGKTDIAQANLLGTDIAWRVLQSSTGYMVQVKTDFGLVATDRTVQGDYDGDGKTDLAVFRSAMSPQDGVFIIRQSSTSTTVTIDFGGLNDYPVAFFNTH